MLSFGKYASDSFFLINIVYIDSSGYIMHLNFVSEPVFYTDTAPWIKKNWYILANGLGTKSFYNNGVDWSIVYKQGLLSKTQAH